MLVRVLEEEEEPEDAPGPPLDEPRARRRPALVAGFVAAACLASLALAQKGSGALIEEEVPSRWGDIPMTCDTLRIEQGDRAIERFRCRALGGAALPVGVFRPPDSNWTSDLTRRPARDSRIEISRAGEVVGWATY